MSNKEKTLILVTITAGPGVGKSTIARTILDSYLKNPLAVTAHVDEIDNEGNSSYVTHKAARGVMELMQPNDLLILVGQSEEGISKFLQKARAA